MRVKDISIYNVSVNLTRYETFTIVKVNFSHGEILINAEMRSDSGIENETKTSDKILTCLGFSQEFIRSMKNDKRV